MSVSKTSLRTPLGRVRGLGAAKEGTGHFMAQRMSALALMFLLPWFMIAAALSFKGGHEAARAFVAHPINSVLLVLFVAAAFYHMRLGLQVVIEDYLTKPVGKTLALLANSFFTVVLTVVAVWAILRVSFGG
jgi:succinate dehydrogenase / fumarate reductase, membrane anchor subunit